MGKITGAIGEVAMTLAKLEKKEISIKDIDKNDDLVEFIKKWYPYYSNEFLSKMIKKEFNITIKSSVISDWIIQYNKENLDKKILKYPLILRKQMLIKNNLPMDDEIKVFRREK